jgi:hypothetical protein
VERRTVAWIAAFAAAAAAFYLADVRGAPERAERSRRAEALVPFAAEDVVEARLFSGVRLARGAGGFALREPVEARADSAAAAALIARLAGARWDRRIGLPADSLAAFGLDPPRAWCALVASDGRAVTIDVGDDAPATGVSRYARIRESGACGIVPSALARDGVRSAAELRDARLVDVAPDAVTLVRVDRPAGRVAIARGPEGVWRLTEPIEARGAGGAVAALVEGIRSSRARAFLDSEEVAAVSGAARRRITLHATGARGPLVVSLGDERPPEGLLVATAPLQQRPVLVDATLAALADADLRAFRESRLFRGSAPSAVAVELALGFDTLRIERAGEEGAWRIVHPETLDADPVRVRALLRNLDVERIVDYADGVAPSAAGLDAPHGAATLRFAATPSAETLRLGAPAPEGDAFYAAVAEAPGEVLVVAGRIAERLAPDAWAFEARRVLEAPLAAARRVRIATSRGAAAFARGRGDAMWRSNGGSLGDAAATRLVQSIARLEPLDRFAAADAGAGAFGFDAPELRIEWDGTRAGRIEVGGALDPTRRFARLVGRRALYIVDAADVDSIRAALAAPP